jgi:hypothetical protein
METWMKKQVAMIATVTITITITNTITVTVRKHLTDDKRDIQVLTPHTVWTMITAPTITTITTRLIPQTRTQTRTTTLTRH